MTGSRRQSGSETEAGSTWPLRFVYSRRPWCCVRGLRGEACKHASWAQRYALGESLAFDRNLISPHNVAYGHICVVRRCTALSTFRMLCHDPQADWCVFPSSKILQFRRSLGNGHPCHGPARSHFSFCLPGRRIQTFVCYFGDLSLDRTNYGGARTLAPVIALPKSFVSPVRRPGDEMALTRAGRLSRTFERAGAHRMGRFCDGNVCCGLWRCLYCYRHASQLPAS